MKLDQDLECWVTLTQIPDLGNAGLRKLLHVFGSPIKIFRANASDLQQHAKDSICDRISAGINTQLIDVVNVWLQDPINSVLTIADSDYPPLLLNMPDPPLLLYAKGNRDLLCNPCLAIVGSRNATAQGVRNAEAFAEASSKSGLCVVSGLAQGIDTAAHVGGLSGPASSIAVVGTGLDKVYPAANRALAHELAERGVLISEFPLGTPPLAQNFPKRNRIISGLSSGCLVVEASLQSGSLITARMALEQGRDVFAIPGSIHSPQSKGCHQLIKQGAKLVDHISDILDELQVPAVLDQDNSRSLIKPNHPILDHLGFDPVDLDTLLTRSGLTIDQLSAILLQLELDGLVSTMPGGFYQRLV